MQHCNRSSLKLQAVILLAVFCASCVPIVIPFHDKYRIGRLFDKSLISPDSSVLLLPVSYRHREAGNTYFLSRATVYPPAERKELLERRDRVIGYGIVTITGNAYGGSHGINGYLMISSKGEVVLLVDCLGRDCTIGRHAGINRQWADNFLDHVVTGTPLVREFDTLRTIEVRFHDAEIATVKAFFGQLEYSRTQAGVAWLPLKRGRPVQHHEKQ